ncbi:hemolysin family protein [Psychroserpens sp.]|uniref:hemolysin family protein n=1 Tax=Psychroserpens sp. TaxID=2020870 RepID=UPI001B01D22B|nr:hemolysin family protein [Psychroserpens sp.]MBO6605834.1 HlyC/CorC family transporter [Psychroserpens sp.]MBO6630471.1 HlyC/CorC family transporter [Psychroserpens sp.]MBO6652795.1 HlyC/CorC family transporter [Psychroserpens sp.]MBO6681433.1 HlyC/CorC family transporter [Psychroserpens sp.]MBO6749208.1 HlyC/CorC family transporter [Psychroserpens sp.]
MDYSIVIIVVMLLLSAFFSGMEIAYVSSNKIHIEIEKKQDDFLALILTKLTEKPSKFIATMLIGNNIALVIYGLVMGDVLVQWFQSLLPSQYQVVNYLLTDLSLLSQTIISTLVILITAEFLPKVFFQIYANSFLKIFAFPAYLFYLLFWFISGFIIWISDFVLKQFFKTDGDDVQLAMTKVELGNYISEQMESVEAHDEVDSEIQIFQNALEFSEVKAREVMVPRTEITALDVKDSIQTISALFIDSGLSKILVYKDTIDDILGYVHSFDLFKRPKSITSVTKPVVYVPATMLIKDVLNILTKKRKSVAVVIDEYGGTAGIMTVEDIVEELVGEIEDEHDSIEMTEERIDEDNYKFSARLEVDYINETYKLNLPESENYETLGGLIVHQAEEIPQENDEVLFDNFKFTILEVSSTKIDLVALHILEED